MLTCDSSLENGTATRRFKILITGAFLLGSIACIATILRIVTLGVIEDVDIVCMSTLIIFTQLRMC